MADPASHAIPEQPSTGVPGQLSRRRLLRFDAIPTTWDQSRTLAGSIGQYAAVARRHGDTWYVGAMTNETSRTLSLPLTFLGSGTYTATVYADGVPGTSPYRTPVVVSTRTVTSATTLDVAMAPAGGQAIILKPS